MSDRYDVTIITTKDGYQRLQELLATDLEGGWADAHDVLDSTDRFEVYGDTIVFGWRERTWRTDDLWREVDPLPSAIERAYSELVDEGISCAWAKAGLEAWDCEQADDWDWGDASGGQRLYVGVTHEVEVFDYSGKICSDEELAVGWTWGELRDMLERNDPTLDQVNSRNDELLARRCLEELFSGDSMVKDVILREAVSKAIASRGPREHGRQATT